jgi:hypothetical protein
MSTQVHLMVLTPSGRPLDTRTREPHMSLHKLTRLTFLLAALLSCSGSGFNSDVSGFVSGVACDWQPGKALTMPAEPLGVCWRDADPEAAMTPEWVNGACDVDEWRLELAAPGQRVNTWWPTLSDDRPMELKAEPGENCE